MPSRAWYSRLTDSRNRTRFDTSTSTCTYAWGTWSARVICAAIPFRIFVIGTRTSSAPGGKTTTGPAAAGAEPAAAGAEPATGPGAPIAAGAAGVAPADGAGAAAADGAVPVPPVRIA